MAVTIIALAGIAIVAAAAASLLVQSASVFFSTNSTGQLAFLANMVGISQSEFSSEGGHH